MWKKINLDVQICIYSVQYISYPHGSYIIFTYKILCLRDPFSIGGVGEGVGKMKWVLDFSQCVLHG